MDGKISIFCDPPSPSMAKVVKNCPIFYAFPQQKKNLQKHSQMVIVLIFYRKSQIISIKSNLYNTLRPRSEPGLIHKHITAYTSWRKCWGFLCSTEHSRQKTNSLNTSSAFLTHFPMTCNNVFSLFQQPGGMFANCGRARYDGAHMCKAMGCACARHWPAHVQSNGVRMAMAHVIGASAKQLGEHAQGNCVGMCKAIGSACAWQRVPHHLWSSLRAESFYWQTIPPQWEGGRLFDMSAEFFYGNSCNSGTESRKMVSKVGN